MSLISDVINGAFEDLGVTRPGETITAALQASAFLVLQQRWALNSLERAFVNTIKHQSLTVVAGTSLYTFGTGGTLVATATPIRITGWASVSGAFRNGGRPVSHEEFALKVKDPIGGASVLITDLAADNAYPSINIRVFPVPAAGPGALILDYWTVLTAFAAVGDSLTGLAPGYEEFLRSDLAMGLYARYARQGAQSMQALAANAANAKGTIMALGASILGLVQAPPQGQGG